jgi:hypothetical protein
VEFVSAIAQTAQSVLMIILQKLITQNAKVAVCALKNVRQK